MRASFGTLSTAGASSFGFAQTLSTGVLIASGSPLRSVIAPRCADIFSVRRWRVSACWFRNSLLSTCRCTARAPSATAIVSEKQQYQGRPADEALRRLGFCFCAACHGRSMTKISVDAGRIERQAISRHLLDPGVLWPRCFALSAAVPIRCSIHRVRASVFRVRRTACAPRASCRREPSHSLRKRPRIRAPEHGRLSFSLEAASQSLRNPQPCAARSHCLPRFLRP